MLFSELMKMLNGSEVLNLIISTDNDRLVRIERQVLSHLNEFYSYYIWILYKSILALHNQNGLVHTAYIILGGQLPGCGQLFYDSEYCKLFGYML
jgi:hypothetical protein